MDFFYWSLTNLHEFRPQKSVIRNPPTVAPSHCACPVGKQWPTTPGWQPTFSNQSLDKGDIYLAANRMASCWICWLKFFHSKTKESCYVVFLLAVFFMFFPSSMILLVSWLLISRASKRKTSTPFSANKPLRYKHKKKNLARGTEWPYLNESKTIHLQSPPKTHVSAVLLSWRGKHKTHQHKFVGRADEAVIPPSLRHDGRQLACLEAPPVGMLVPTGRLRPSPSLFWTWPTC